MDKVDTVNTTNYSSDKEKYFVIRNHYFYAHYSNNFPFSLCVRCRCGFVHSVANKLPLRNVIAAITIISKTLTEIENMVTKELWNWLLSYYDDSIWKLIFILNKHVNDAFHFMKISALKYIFIYAYNTVIRRKPIYNLIWHVEAH